MISRRHTTIYVFALLLLSSFLIFTYFSKQKERNQTGLEVIDFRFKTIVANGTDTGVLDLEVLRYTDVTYIDLSIEMTNEGDTDLSLRNPKITFYLEEIYVQEKELDDTLLPAKGSSLIRLEEITFDTEIINEALKGRIGRPEEALYLKGILSSEYSYELLGIGLKKYTLDATIEGQALLRQIFGGKTQEEAVEEILKLL